MSENIVAEANQREYERRKAQEAREAEERGEVFKVSPAGAGKLLGAAGALIAAGVGLDTDVDVDGS